MSEKQEKVSYRKETYIVFLTWFVPWLFGKVEGWLGETEWKVPKWVQQSAAWFAKDAPISNALLLSLMAALVYGVWLVIRLYRGWNHAIVSWKAEIAQLRGALESARNAYKMQQDIQGRSQLELAALREKLATSEKEREAAEQKLAGRLAKPEPKVFTAITTAYQDLFREATIEHVHWRWDYHPASSTPTDFRSFCEQCDMPIDLGRPQLLPGNSRPAVKCGTCDHRIHLNRTAFQEMTHAKDTVERAIRLNTWPSYSSKNEERICRITTSASTR
ncbi:hypothetical protein [Cupriavidus taiwanensis]|uniref:hypothetical protein n=1 Tax=Cupriavidus taiwanensis TaxID=164546 RepID=UPI001F002350|nr:hypothetical protein [Cupriavidus taiwanensis]